MQFLEIFQKIKEKNKFEIPEILQLIYQDGRTQYNANQEESEKKFPLNESVNDLPALLCATDFEWMQPEEILAWDPPDFWKKEFIFIPFAKTRGGDLWCFFPQWKERNNVPIVLAYMEDNLTEAYAPHIEGFIYRQMLESFGHIDEFTLKNFDNKQEFLRAYLNGNIQVIAPYLRKEWINSLHDIVQRDFQRAIKKYPKRVDEFWCLIDPDELNLFIQKRLFFSHFGEQFMQEI